MFCASVMYPPEIPGFDFEYFATKHAPMFAEMLGDNCRRWEVHRPLATPGSPTPPFSAAAYFWVESAERFGTTLAEHGEADLRRHTQFQHSATDSRMGLGRTGLLLNCRLDRTIQHLARVLATSSKETSRPNPSFAEEATPFV